MASPRVLAGRYEVLETLGEGPFTITSRARDRRTGLPCVVKALSLRQVDEPKLIDLFEREGRVLAHLEHPRIPRFVDSFAEDTDEGRKIFLVQGYVEGKSLAQLVAEGRHFTEREVLSVAVDVAEVLQYIHGFSPPIIHRDIKPGNVVLDAGGRAHLVDFGAVRDKVLHGLADADERRTIVGTYGYMPFEQFEGEAFPTSDTYSLGATLVFLLSHKDPAEMEKKDGRLDFRPHVNVSPAFARVLARMLETDRRRRYESAAALRTDLEAARSGRLPRTFGAWAGALAALAVGLVLVGLFLLLSERREARKAVQGPSPSVPAREPAKPDQAGSPLPRAASGAEPQRPPAAPPPPVTPNGGVLRVDVHRQFAFDDSGWPGGLSVGQTQAGGLDSRPYEALVREPAYRSPGVLYGYLMLGNGPDPRYTFVIDDLDRPTWIAYVDRNNNEDLTDDGPPRANQGSGRMAFDLLLDVEAARADGAVVRFPYKVWFWVNEKTPKSEGAQKRVASFYARCHYRGRLLLAGREYRAVSFEMAQHDGLLRESGLFIDLDGDGKLVKESEHFRDGDEVRVGDQAWRLRLDYP